MDYEQIMQMAKAVLQEIRQDSDCSDTQNYLEGLIEPPTEPESISYCSGTSSVEENTYA